MVVRVRVGVRVQAEHEPLRRGPGVQLATPHRLQLHAWPRGCRGERLVGPRLEAGWVLLGDKRASHRPTLAAGQGIPGSRVSTPATDCQTNCQTDCQTAGSSALHHCTLNHNGILAHLNKCSALRPTPLLGSVRHKINNTARLDSTRLGSDEQRGCWPPDYVVSRTGARRPGLRGEAVDGPLGRSDCGAGAALRGSRFALSTRSATLDSGPDLCRWGRLNGL